MPIEADPAYHIVLLEDAPLASYHGGLRGLPATSAMATGQERLDTDSPTAEAYLDHLEAVQQQTIDAIESVTGHPSDVLYTYRYATNGLAVRLTDQEARQIAQLPGVLAVESNELQKLDTDAGPHWIGAPQMWDGSAVGDGVGTYGEGIVVGIIDTGINMDHPSFAAVDERGYQHTNPKGKYLGFCDPDNPYYSSDFKCNDKLIGVYSFLTSPPNALNPEDDHGHGSHTASTTAGNFVTLYRKVVTGKIRQTFSGVAPHANIIAYDTCFANGAEGACPPVSTLKALDQALIDGVDVVNYSISTSTASPWRDSTMLAFKSLREAGIVAAVSAGNEGPGVSTTKAMAPWVMAVAASTHGRFFANSLSDMSGGATAPPATMTGGGMTGGSDTLPIVYAGRGDFINVDGKADDGRCLRRFPPGTFDGAIVVCDAGGSASRVQRGSSVQAGGAAGLILANEASQGEKVYSDNHLIPAVHIGAADGQALREWLAQGEGHVAKIDGSHFEPRDELGGTLARFSSRGPAKSRVCCRRPGIDSQTMEEFDVIKPDLTAPGVDIIAAVASRPGSTPPEFASMSGTSMASPHIAGAAALLKAARPEWTAAEIQSALMLTAVSGDVRMQDGRSPAGWFDKGAGRADVGRAARTGLLMDVTSDEMDAADPEIGGSPSDVNLPSMADANCLAGCGWTRRVRNPLSRKVTWTVFHESQDKLPIVVRPARFTIGPGETVELRVEVTARGLPLGKWTMGDILLVPNAHDVPEAHMPVAVRHMKAKLPQFHVSETSSRHGSAAIEGLEATDVEDLQITVRGLVRGNASEMQLEEDPSNDKPFDQPGGKGTHVSLLTIGADARSLVAEITASEAEDIDLYVGRDSNGDGKPQERETLCISGWPSWNELCEVRGSDLRPGKYWILVQNFTASKAPPDAVTLVTAVVGQADEGNLTVTAPEAVEDGEPFDLVLSWSLDSLSAGDRWLGLLDLGSAQGRTSDLGTIAVDLLGTSRPAYIPIAHRPRPSIPLEP
jgi:subtilisin family serine protease